MKQVINSIMLMTNFIDNQKTINQMAPHTETVFWFHFIYFMISIILLISFIHLFQTFKTVYSTAKQHQIEKRLMKMMKSDA